jgi:DNA-binding response OmpR family regulator
MPLSSLFVCQDPHLLRIFQDVLRDLDIGLQSCATIGEARRLLSRRKFDAVLIECDSRQENLLVLKSLRHFPHNKHAISIVITRNRPDVTAARKGGAHFIIESPLVLPRVTATLRAAKNLMHRERRLSLRRSIRKQVSFTRDNRENFEALILDLSPTGIAIRSEKTQFTKSQPVRLRFLLPATDSAIEIHGHVVWADDHGRTGISFTTVHESRAGQLDLWLREHRRWRQKATPQLRAKLTQDGSEPVEATVLDLSDGEMAIRCTERLETGTLVEVQLLSPRFSEHVPAPAKVVWAHHTGAAGISFLQHNPELERIIKLWTH